MHINDRVWSDHELDDPHGAADKARRVRRMFAAIAPRYDLNNRLHSLGRDQAWRRAAVKMAKLRRGEHVLDVACGTGDLAMAFAASGAGSVVGADFTFDMLAIARRKTKSLSAGAPHYHAGDALRLPIKDHAVDVVSIAFGIRNVVNPAVAISEFYRVLRPGGRLVILEFAMPANPLLRCLYNGYFQHVMPRTAALIARDRSGAYRYLPRSVSTFIGRSAILSMMQDAGLTDTATRSLSLGIATLYLGVKQTG